MQLVNALQGLARAVRKKFRRRKLKTRYRGKIPIYRMEEVVREIRKEGRNIMKSEVADRLHCSRKAFYRMLEANPEIREHFEELVKKYE